MCWAEEFHLYSVGFGTRRKILSVEMIHVEEACIIHTDSKKEENHLDEGCLGLADRQKGI